MPESAMADAQAAETEITAGLYRGPLHGVPIAVKDLFWTKGVATAAGMPIHRDYRPAEDATVVRRLRQAGAVLLGKLQLTEGAYSDHHPSVAPPLNPWNADFWPGISSSGPGVATAAGLCFGAVASDTGGSIRWPCAANGLTGLKPSWGRVSRYGAFELARRSIMSARWRAAQPMRRCCWLPSPAATSATRRRCPTPCRTIWRCWGTECAACASASTSHGTAMTWMLRRKACCRKRPKYSDRWAPASSRCRFPT